MSFLRRIVSRAGAAPRTAPALPGAALTVGALIRRRARIAARRPVAGLAREPLEESNGSWWPEAGVVPAAPSIEGGPPSKRRETEVAPPVADPRGVAGDGRAPQVGSAQSGKQEVSRDFYERIESSNPVERVDKRSSNPDAKDLSVQGLVVIGPSESPPLRPAAAYSMLAAPLAASAVPVAAFAAPVAPGRVPRAVRTPRQAAMRADGDSPAAPPGVGGFAPAFGVSGSTPGSLAVGAASVEGPTHAAATPEIPPSPAAPSANSLLHFDEVQPPQPEPFFAAPAPQVGPAEASAPEPTVHIGSIEIIIEAPAEPRAAPAPASAAPDLSSRFYLRGL